MACCFGAQGPVTLAENTKIYRNYDVIKKIQNFLIF